MRDVLKGKIEAYEHLLKLSRSLKITRRNEVVEKERKMMPMHYIKHLLEKAKDQLNKLNKAKECKYVGSNTDQGPGKDGKENA